MNRVSMHFRKWFYVLMGNLLYALALSLFLTANKIAAGGLAGIAVVLSSIVPIGVGVMTFIMNVPILISAGFMNGWLYTLDTMIAAVMYSVTVELFSALPVLTTDPMVAAIFGGFLYGIGMAFLTIGNGSVGGTDLLCRLLHKKIPFVSVAKMSLFIDGGIVIFAMFVYGNVEVGLYAVITIVVCSFVADRVILGIERGSICMIISAKGEHELARPLMDNLGSAVTRWSGNGMYSGDDKNIFIVAIRPREVHSVKKLLKNIDPHAFVIVITANELIGGNFSGGVLGK